MELLKTIWNTLNTQNELITNIICSPLTFIEVYISALLFSYFLNIKSTKKQFITYVIIFSLIAITTIFVIPTPFNTFVNILACPILVYFIFKTSILKSILSEFIPYIFFVLVGNLLLKIYIVVFNLSTDMALYIPIYKFLFSCIMYLVTYIIYLILKKLNVNISLHKNPKKQNNFILILNFILGFIALAFQSYIMTIYSNYIPLYLTCLTIAIFFIYFIFTIFSLLRTIKLEVTSEKLEEEQLYNKTLTILHDNIRGFKHDFNNIVQSIGGYISSNNMDGLKDYYSELLTDCQKINNLAILNPELINNSAVYSLLTSKYYKAESLGIKMNFDIFLDLNTLNIKTYNLTRILGILLDNAIEASNLCSEKIVNINVKRDSKSNRDLFIIENTYANKSIDTDKIFEKGYTSKNDDDNLSHGLGLWNARKIIKKSNNLNLFTSKNDKFFKQQLEIYY